MNYGYSPQQFQAPYQAQYMPQQMNFTPLNTAPQGPMDRLAELQYNAQMRDAQAQARMMTQQPQGPRMLSVGSIDEAKGFLSPNDGSCIYFVNNNLNEIYSKQLDFSTGKSIFNVYKLIPIQEPPASPQEPVKAQGNDFITREEYDTLRGEYEAIKDEIQFLKKELKYYEAKSNAGNQSNQKWSEPAGITKSDGEQQPTISKNS